MLRTATKIFLFLSAYYPLEILMILKYLRNKKAALIYSCIGLTISIACILFLLKYVITKLTEQKIKVTHVKNITGESLNYIIPYIFAFIELDLKNLIDLITLILTLITILVIYINSNLLYVNPLFTLFGFKVFEVLTEKSETIIIISREIVRTNKKYTIKRLDGGIFIEFGSKEHS